MLVNENITLKKGSNVKVEAICDYCGLKRSISYKEYNKNIKINNKFSCSRKCGSLKSKETNLIKYGVDSVNKLKEKKEKAKNTIIDKYGVDHISKIDNIRDRKSLKMKSIDVSDRISKFWGNISEDDILKINEKRKSTNKDKYGIENISQLDKTKEKVKNTNLNKYGGFTFQSEMLMDKVNSTNLNKYGLTYSMRSEEIKEKVKNTNLSKYGYEYASMNSDIKDKAKSTNIERYGSKNIMQSEEFRKIFNISNENGYIKYFNKVYQFKCSKCSNIYNIDYDNYYKRKLRKCETCTLCFPISETSSIKEKEFFSFISSIYNGEIIGSYRDKYEIDVYLPELKLGLEFNGLYWHSELFRIKNYHLEKKEYFRKKGIKIIHIWEDDWDYKKEIIKSQVKNWLGKTSSKIYARKCDIKEISDPKLVSSFLNTNHIQGYIRSSLKIGLFHDEKLVCIMTFDQIEGRKKMDPESWNLSRFCGLLDYNIIGSMSKILKYFINKYNPSRIISFADRDWSEGDIYYKSNFDLIKIIKPDYKYIYKGRRLNKQKFTKKKLEKLGYDISKTENEITNEIGMVKIYNSGQLKFEMNINKIHI